MRKTDLKKFCDNAVEQLRNGSNATFFLRLGNTKHCAMIPEDKCLYAVVGWQGGFEYQPKTENPNADGKYRICAKLAYNCDDLQCDFDWDWMMPHNPETGEVCDTCHEYDDINSSDYLFKEWSECWC